jgi:hypothetical protein
MSDERRINKGSKTAIYESLQGLCIQYAEVLRLRQAVREAEAQASDTKFVETELNSNPSARGLAN